MSAVQAYEPAGPATDDAVLEHRTRLATDRKCCVVYPEANQLFVDIDDFESLGVFHANVGSLPDVSFHTVTISPSRKAGRYHATVHLGRDVKDEFERIALQLLLGSDRAREAIAWKRAIAGVKLPTCFFESLAEKKAVSE